jgi:hypothetical protein
VSDSADVDADITKLALAAIRYAVAEVEDEDGEMPAKIVALTRHVLERYGPEGLQALAAVLARAGASAFGALAKVNGHQTERPIRNYELELEFGKIMDREWPDARSGE